MPPTEQKKVENQSALWSLFMDLKMCGVKLAYPPSYYRVEHDLSTWTDWQLRGLKVE